MIKLMNRYNYQLNKLERRKARTEESKLINHTDEPITRELDTRNSFIRDQSNIDTDEQEEYTKVNIKHAEREKLDKDSKRITRECYIRGFFIEDTSMQDTDRQKECTRVKIEHPESELDEDNRDNEYSTEENIILKTFYIEQLKSDLFSLIYREFKQYTKAIEKQMKDEAKERTIGDAVDTATLEVIKKGLSERLVPDKLESIPVPSISITYHETMSYTLDNLFDMNISLLERFIRFVEKYLTAKEVLNLNNNTSTAKSFVDYLHSLEQTKDEQYTEGLNVLNHYVLKTYLIYNEYVSVALYEWHVTFAQERYDRIWKNYPKGELKLQDHHYIISNSDATEYNLTTDHIIRAISHERFRCKLYWHKFNSARAQLVELNRSMLDHAEFW